MICPCIVFNPFSSITIPLAALYYAMTRGNWYITLAVILITIIMIGKYIYNNSDPKNTHVMMRHNL